MDGDSLRVPLRTNMRTKAQKSHEKSVLNLTFVEDTVSVSLIKGSCTVMIGFIVSLKARDYKAKFFCRALIWNKK